MSEIHFGTDGWRAIIADDFTFANLGRVTQATATYWRQNHPAHTRNLIVVGFDRRFLSDRFARRSADIIAANGFDVILTPVPTPTPSVSYAVDARRAVGGIMITASHNPPHFNGFKLKAHYGGPAGPDLCQAVEKCIDLSPPKVTGAPGRVTVEDLRGPHFAAIKKLVDFQLIAKSKLRFAHDALFGVGAGCFDEILKGTTCRVTTLNARWDANFGGINPEPIARNYGPTIAYLQRHQHDLCLVTDGDADRIGGLDGRGRVLSTHQLICLLLHHFVVNRGGQGRVVKALTTTSMVDKMCAKFGLPLTETGVGFKHICGEMLRGGVLLGFEESGGIGFPGHVPERDGILAGLILLEMLATERKSINRLLAGLTREFGPHCYARLDAPFPAGRRAALMEYCRNHPPARLLRSTVVSIQSYDGVKFTARDGSWLMLRGSGTEPIIRIYAEAATAHDAGRLIEAGCRLASRA